jgi:PAS domain S-box-containing protein
MRDVDADKRGLAGESQALHSQKPKLEQVSHNLPGHKNVDEELDRVWRGWKSIFDVIKDSIILINGEFKIIQANRASSQLFGRPLDQIIGKTCWRLVHGTNEAPEECPLKRAKITKKYEQIELYLPEKDIWIEASVSPVFDRQGNLSGAIHIIRDITDRKQTEELLRKERDKAQKYLDVAGVILVAIDAEQRVGLINKKGCEILGYSEKEVIAKNWFDNFLPKRVRNKVRELSDKMLKGEIEVNEYFENPVLTKSGDERLIGWHGVILRDEKGVIIGHLSSGEDITERKKAEGELRKFKTISDKAGYGVTIVDLAGNVIYNNPAYDKMHGYVPGELIGKHLSILHPEWEMVKVNRGIEQLKREGSYVSWEVWHRRNNNTEFPTLMTGTLIKDENGTPLFMAGTAVDITERKRAEEALRESEERFSTVFCTSPIGIVITRIDDGQIIDANPAFLEMFGKTRDEIIGHTSLELNLWIHTEERDGFIKVLREQGRIQNLEMKYHRKSGELGDLFVSVELISLAGEPRMLSLIYDITERKRAEEALKKAENEKTTILNTMSELVAYQDAEHRIVWANRAACESVGLTTEKLLGRYCYEIWQRRNKPCADCPVEKAWKTGRLEIEEIHSPDGRVWSIRANPVKNKAASVIGVVEIILDITERKKAEQKLIDYQAKLKSLASQLTLAEERERRRLATELHDRISQALVVSKIKLDALRKLGRSRKLNKALEDVCNSIDQTIQDTKTLTFDLGSPVLHELGFETAVSEWLTNRIQKKHGITVEFEDDGKPKPLDDDVRILLFRDVRELLTNVAKHSSAHKVKVSIRKVGSEIHISVEDDGWGFDTKKAAATAVRNGGFGLFSIRERLGQLGGHLEIESEPGCGTKATLVAPLKQEKVNRKGKE